jgi:hypothetical protein
VDQRVLRNLGVQILDSEISSDRGTSSRSAGAGIVPSRTDSRFRVEHMTSRYGRPPRSSISISGALHGQRRHRHFTATVGQLVDRTSGVMVCHLCCRGRRRRAARAGPCPARLWPPRSTGGGRVARSSRSASMTWSPSTRALWAWKSWPLAADEPRQSLWPSSRCHTDQIPGTAGPKRSSSS